MYGFSEAASGTRSRAHAEVAPPPAPRSPLQRTLWANQLLHALPWLATNKAYLNLVQDQSQIWEGTLLLGQGPTCMCVVTGAAVVAAAGC